MDPKETLREALADMTEICEALRCGIKPDPGTVRHLRNHLRAYRKWRKDAREFEPAWGLTVKGDEVAVFLRAALFGLSIKY